jgi:hypothetical protein
MKYAAVIGLATGIQLRTKAGNGWFLAGLI